MRKSIGIPWPVLVVCRVQVDQAGGSSENFVGDRPFHKHSSLPAKNLNFLINIGRQQSPTGEMVQRQASRVSERTCPGREAECTVRFYGTSGDGRPIVSSVWAFFARLYLCGKAYLGLLHEAGSQPRDRRRPSGRRGVCLGGKPLRRFPAPSAFEPAIAPLPTLDTPRQTVVRP